VTVKDELVTALIFDREFDAVPGRVDVIAPALRRVLAPNPGPFTFLGTGTYLVGTDEIAVIDPGPADNTHLDAIITACSSQRITHIVVTHTHADHSPGATIVGCAPHPSDDRADPSADEVIPAPPEVEAARSALPREQHESVDRVYAPQQLLSDGDVISGTGWSLEAVHTPGHIANHLCFGWAEAGVLFSGDHVMRWSTSVISPPTGDMRAYLSSLDKVLDRPERVYWPTHGPAVTDPAEYVGALLAHRRERSEQIVAVLTQQPSTIAEIVDACYRGLDPRLVQAAGRSVLAHLLDLRESAIVASVRDESGPSTWFLC
jgi:glyoxylase-like metal-dependent hydrolase (beta-lactamase superfamily II)